MAALFSRWIRPAVAIVLLSQPAVAQTGRFDLAKTKTVVTGLIEQALKERGVPSISIAMVRGDSIVWTAAFGYSNVYAKTPATPATLYSTGSTFKAVTATALMQLQEQGKFKLDQAVNQYLGDIQIQDQLQSDKPVTFRHILSHWSGLKSGAITKEIWRRELPKTLEAMVAGLYSIRAPEVKYEYNNFAYGMAGLLIEKISKADYETYVLEHILKPLGVTTPHPVYPSPEMVERMALPYMPGGANGKPQPVAQVHFDVYPAGDIYLTAEDMVRFLGAQLNGGVFQGKRILSEAAVKAMQQPQFGGTYAFGLSVRKDDNGHTIISHSGGIPGQSSYMVGDVDSKVGVYFMSNSGAPASIAEAGIRLLQGLDYVPPPPLKGIAVDAAILDRYVGVYELSADLVFTITRDGTKLLARQNDQPEQLELLAKSPTTFYAGGVETTITFVAGATGVVEKAVLEAGGAKYDLFRKKNP